MFETNRNTGRQISRAEEGIAEPQEPQHQQYSQQPGRQNAAAKAKALASAVCYCCGRQGHYATKCSQRLSAFCTYCNIRGHVLAVCKRSKGGAGGPGGGAGGAGGSGGSGGGAAAAQPRPKLLPHGKKAQARGGAVAFVLGEVMAAFEGAQVAEVVEWLGDTGASRHVCNDLSLMVDVRTREKPILLRQLVGDIRVYTTGTVKLDCPDGKGGSRVVSVSLTPATFLMRR